MPARRDPPTVLLTGFAPFGGDARNPSWDAIAPLHRRRIGGHRVVARCLPVEFGASSRTLRAAIRETRPRMVVCVGLAAGRDAISLERIAINVDDARIPDNAGACPVDAAVVPGAPAAYFATLPIKAMRAALRDAGIPAEVSQTAGTYVCNHVFYALMHALQRTPAVRAGFIHVPPACHADGANGGVAGQVHHPGNGGERPSGLPLATITEALRIAVRVALATGDDLRQAAGAEH